MKTMIQNYKHRRDEAGDIVVMEFHRKHLLLFLDRFQRFAAKFRTPSSALISHDIFLVITAATTVAKSDWANLDRTVEQDPEPFLKYFASYDNLATGLEPLHEGVPACIAALSETR